MACPGMALAGRLGMAVDLKSLDPRKKRRGRAPKLLVGQEVFPRASRKRHRNRHDIGIEIPKVVTYGAGKHKLPTGLPQTASLERLSITAAFHRAIRQVKVERNIDLLKHFVEQAIDNPQVLIACMNKLLPNKHQVSIGPEELERVVEKIVFICVKHVKDPVAMRDIQLDIENLSRDREFLRDVPTEMTTRLKDTMRGMGVTEESLRQKADGDA